MTSSAPVTSSAPGPSGRDLVTAYLADQSAEIERAGRAVAAGEPEGVHDLRVACRRARSALRSHRRLLRRTARPGAADLVGDLRQLGLDLSGPRDDEVVRELLEAWAHQDGWPEDTLQALLGGLDPAQVPGAAASTVAVRATSLGSAVDAWAEHADWRERASGAPGDVLVPVIRRTANRLRQRVARADAATPEQSAASWHEVRKAAKRVRYTGEVAVPAVTGAKAVVTAAKALQTAIGDEQDARLVLDRLSRRPDAPRAAVLLATERARRAVRDAGDAAPPALRDLTSAVGDLT